MGDVTMAADTVMDPVQLSHKLIYSAHQLGMYNAELARVLHLQCPDIGQLISGQAHLTPGSHAWRQAVLFVHFCEILSDRLAGDEVAMFHWLRAENRVLGGVPHLLIVDEDRLQTVLDYLVSVVELSARDSEKPASPSSR